VTSWKAQQNAFFCFSSRLRGEGIVLVVSLSVGEFVARVLRCKSMEKRRMLIFYFSNESSVDGNRFLLWKI
jgi:hypothetical protein